MTYFVGMPLSVIFYVIICKIFPPPGLGIAEGLEGYGVDLKPFVVVEGETTEKVNEIDGKSTSDTGTKARSVDEIESL